MTPLPDVVDVTITGGGPFLVGWGQQPPGYGLDPWGDPPPEVVDVSSEEGLP